MFSGMTHNEQRRLTPSEPAPEICLQDSNNSTICLSDFKGKRVVLYFYPKDNTPGCTAQACEYNDIYSRLREMDVELIGISPDSIESHKKFSSQFGLTFRLLSDPTKEALKTYGAYGEKKNYGKIYEGVIRSAFVISSDGYIEATFYNVKAKGNAKRVLEYLETHTPA